MASNILSTNTDLILASDARLRMQSQNRFRCLNSAARVKRTSVQVIPTATETAVNFDVEDFDTDTIHDTVTNNTRLTCKLAGKYTIGGCIEWEASGTGTRRIHIQLNGTTNIAHSHIPTHATDEIAHVVSTIYTLAVNDYLELYVYQNSGGDLDVLAGDGACNFWMYYIGE